MNSDTLWQKTVTDLKEGLLSSEDRTGEKFPSLIELSREYGISKITALRVVSELEKLGLVKRVPRRGTFIIGRFHLRAIKVLLDFNENWGANALPIIWRYLHGIEDACNRSRCSMQIVSMSHVLGELNQRDRYIILTANPDNDSYQELSEKGCNYIFIHSSSRLPEHDCIFANYRQGGRIMTQNMINAGHRRIAYIGGSPTSAWHAPRIRGYLDALEEAGLPLDMKLVGEISITVPSPGDADAEVDRLLQMSKVPTAIVVSDDLRALEVLACLERKGISVPAQMAVSGMDARIEAVKRSIPLVTCDWHFEKQGEMAVDFLLFPPVSGDSPREILVEPTLVEGGTV